jgi:enoyl-CoA hydratase/carnithine racemase
MESVTGGSDAGGQEFRLELADRVAVLTLDRPKKKNALTFPLLEGAAPAVEALHGREDVRVLVVTGAGAAFCSGADLVANAGALQGGIDAARAGMARFHRLLLAVWNFPGPSVAAISGDAVGFGMDLALACDLRIARRSARLAQSFGKIGLVPDGGSSLTLSRIVGTAKAAELMLLCDFVGAEEAERLGLVNRVADDAAFEGEWRGLAARLAKGAPLAQRLGKANMRKSLGISMEQALANEAEAQMRCITSQDVMVGVMAWMQGQQPEFTGR